MTRSRRETGRGAVDASPVAVSLARPSRADRDRFLAAVRRSQDLLRPWTSLPTDDAGFDAYLRRYAPGADDLAGATHLSYLVERGDELVGVVNANEIVRGNLASAHLGYNAFRPHAGRGLMRAGLCLVLDVLFGPVHLHRVEANIQPANTRSIALVRSLGFRHEGFSPRYLRIDGAWRDHERFALLADEWLPHRRG